MTNKAYELDLQFLGRTRVFLERANADVEKGRRTARVRYLEHYLPEVFHADINMLDDKYRNDRTFRRSLSLTKLQWLKFERLYFETFLVPALTD